MTKGIDEFLNLPRLEDALRASGEHPFADEEEEISEESKELIENMDEAVQNMMRMEGTDHEEAMDAIYEETLKHAQDLVDMAYNVDLPRARGIFEQANNFYAKAIEAKNSKRDAQLKMAKLMLEKRRLDLMEKKNNNDMGEPVAPTGSVMVEDRNSLLDLIRKSKENKEKPKE